MMRQYAAERLLVKDGPVRTCKCWTGRRGHGRNMTTENVLLEKDGSTARLVLNRPEKGNAMPFDSLDRLIELLHEAENDDDIKVIILKGRGSSFCVGDDFE